MEIGWSPNDENEFYVFGNELSVCDIRACEDDVKTEGTSLSRSTYAKLISVSVDPSYKCIAWRPGKNPDHLFAIGLATTGKVLLRSYTRRDQDDDRLSLIGREFSLRHPRSCNYLHWNPMDTNLLAEGVDRVRQEHSIMIWDVSSTSEVLLPAGERKYSINEAHVSRPLYEIGASETSVSLCWFKSQPKTFVSGMSNKIIRIIDLRESSRQQQQRCTSSRAVFNVTVDSLCETRLASCLENQIMIWDSRYFEKPLSVVQSANHISRLSWCPTRAGLLGCVCRDSHALKLYDVRQSDIDSSEGTSAPSSDPNHPSNSPLIVERIIQAEDKEGSGISWFDWHPTESNRMLTVSNTGRINEVRVRDRIPLSWSADIYLSWVAESEVHLLHTVRSYREMSEDISVKMRRRALKGYGSVSIEENLKCSVGDEQLKKLWSWMLMVSELRASGVQLDIDYSYPGVRTVLKSENQSSSRIEQDGNMWAWICSDQQSADHMLVTELNTYWSVARQKCLRLCGWVTDRQGNSLTIVSRLEAEGEFERAAAIACFTQNYVLAVEILQKGAMTRRQNSQYTMPDVSAVILNTMVLTLTVYLDDRDGAWRDVCSTSQQFLHNPYLQAIIHLLTSESIHDLQQILNSTELDVSDRIAVACIYMPDNKLTEYIDQLNTKYLDDASLIGIQITGITREGLDLLERYVDVTSDIQTVSIILLEALPSHKLLSNRRVRDWIEDYRDILDRWSLWKERAELDIYMRKRDSSLLDSPQVVAGCNFCSKSISLDSLAKASWSVSATNASSQHMRQGSRLSSGPVDVPSQAFVWQSSCCPSCRKPLPRCTLCLLHMGTASGTSKSKQAIDGRMRSETSHKLTPISNWFTWCQTCRHGGHANHVAEWFEAHDECPVFGCHCRCATTDVIRKLSPEEPTAMVQSVDEHK